MPDRRTEKAAVIHVRVVWGTRRLHLAARFAGPVLLGLALLALFAIIAVCGPRWIGR